MYLTNLQKQTPTLLLISSMEDGCSSAYSINLNIVPNLNKDYHQISITHPSLMIHILVAIDRFPVRDIF